MQQEQFPIEVDYQTEHTRLELQGNEITCTTFGTTSAWEAMLARLGIYTQLAPRFIWWCMRGRTLSVQSVVDVVEQNGVCLDSLHPYTTEPFYPYNPIGLNTSPSLAAFEDAKTRLPKGIKPVRISGKEQCMRWLARGSALTFVKVLPGGAEHCMAGIGYNSYGLKIHDSGNNIYYHAWEDLGTVITQVYRWEGFPLVPHPDYIEGDIPEINGSVFTVPKCQVYTNWQTPIMNFKNITFNLIDRGVISDNQPDIKDDVFWHSGHFTLTLPKLIIDGIMKYRVTMVNPIATLVSAEEG